MGLGRSGWWLGLMIFSNVADSTTQGIHQSYTWARWAKPALNYLQSREKCTRTHWNIWVLWQHSDPYMGHPFLEISTDIPHLLPKPLVNFYIITHQAYCCNLFWNPSFNLLLIDCVTCEHHHKMHFTDQIILEGFLAASSKPKCRRNRKEDSKRHNSREKAHDLIIPNTFIQTLTVPDVGICELGTWRLKSLTHISHKWTH